MATYQSGSTSSAKNAADSGSISVRNIGAATQAEISHIFGTFGHLENVNIVSPSVGPPMALVTFSDPQNAHAAVSSTDLQTKAGNKLVVTLSGSSSGNTMTSNNPYASGRTMNSYYTNNQQSNNTLAEESYHVYVGDIGPDVDNAKLKEVFSEFGNITQSKVIKDTSTQTSKGYGFVTFSKREDAERAITQKNGSWLGFSLIKCNWATRKPTNTNRNLKYDEVYKQASQNNTTAYIGNLDINISPEEVRNICSQQGKIVDLKLYNEKGYGFAKYATKDEACRAIVNIHGTKINGTTLKASWGKEDSVLSSNPGNVIDYSLAQSLSAPMTGAMGDLSSLYMAQQQQYPNMASMNPYTSLATQYAQQSALPYTNVATTANASGSTTQQQQGAVSHQVQAQSAGGTGGAAATPSGSTSSQSTAQQQALALQQMYMMMYQQQMYNNQMAAAAAGNTSSVSSQNSMTGQSASVATQPSGYGPNASQQQQQPNATLPVYWNVPKSAQ